MMKNAMRLLGSFAAVISMVFVQSCGDDDDVTITPVSINFSQTALTVGENSGANTVTVNFGDAVPADATFNVTIGGDAVYTDDYTTDPDGSSGSFTVSVASGVESQTFSFTPVDNADVDGDKTVTFTITTDSDAIDLGTAATLTVTIDDDEGATNIDFAETEASVSEDNGAYTVMLNLGATTSAAGTVDITVSGAVDAITSDPAAETNVITVSVAAETAASTMFTVTPVNDTEFTDDREVVFTMTGATNGLEVGTAATTFTLTITEDDALSIAEARSATGTVKIQGTVITPDYGFSNGQYYVQDATGGINVFHDDVQGLVSQGDLVEIVGEIGSFAEQINISPAQGDETVVTVLSQGNDLPAAVTIQEAGLTVDNALQGSLVTISGVSITENQWPVDAISSGSNKDVDAMVGTTAFLLTIDRGESFYDGTAIPGEPLTVTGVLARDGDDVQIFPFNDGDIVAGGIPPSITVTETLTVFSGTDNGTVSASEQSYTIEGSELDNDVIVTAPAGFGIAKASGTVAGDYTAQLTFTAAELNGGAQTVFVRFIPASGVDQTISGAIVHASDDFITVAVDVSGEETGNAAPLFIETFDNANGFTTSVAFFSDVDVSSGFDFFGIADLNGDGGEDFGGVTGTTNVKSYTGFSDNILTGMDLDGESATLPITIDWTGIDISGQASIQIALDMAEFDDGGDIDQSDFVLIQYQIDGGGYQNYIQYVGEEPVDLDGINGYFYIDADFDGTADDAVNDTPLGSTAQSISGAEIALNSNSTLDIRISISVNAGDEDIAIDNLRVIN